MKKALYSICLVVLLLSSPCCVFWDELIDLSESLAEREPSEPSWGPDYLEKVKAQPLDFQIVAGEDAKAWKRARRGLRRYADEERWVGSDNKLRVSTDDVLEIDVPEWVVVFEDVGYLIRIVRTPRGDSTDYSICYAPVKADSVERPPIRLQAQAIAYYIDKGKSPEFWYIDRNPDY